MVLFSFRLVWQCRLSVQNAVTCICEARYCTEMYFSMKPIPTTSSELYQDTFSSLSPGLCQTQATMLIVPDGNPSLSDSRPVWDPSRSA